MTALLLKIFWTFFVIGLFNFGGGGAMLSLIQAQVVSVNGWLSEEAFTNIVAISQSTPGPIGINCATFTGYEVLHSAGASQLSAVFGSAVATFAVVLPSFLVFFVIVKIFNKFHEKSQFRAMMSVLHPAVAGLIAAAAVVLIVDVSLKGGVSLRLLTDNFPDWKAWLLFAAAFILSYTRKAGPILLIVASGFIGLTIF